MQLQNKLPKVEPGIRRSAVGLIVLPSFNHQGPSLYLKHKSETLNPIDMHFTKYFTIVALVAAGALAAPTEPKQTTTTTPAAKPTKPTKPAQPTATVVQQTNQCGNGATPYCCNTDNSGKYTTCSVLGTSPATAWRQIC